MYSTTASGPFSTWRPCGRENVLRPGMIPFAIEMIFWDSSGVHIEAVNFSQGQFNLILRSSRV